MKRTMLIFACVITLVTSACADNYQPITRDQLPQKAQTFLSTFFSESKASLMRKDFDVQELVTMSFLQMDAKWSLTAKVIGLK